MSQYTSPEHHPAFEEYCETIFELAEDGLQVIQARIAERLDVSRPAVSEMVRRLTEEGLVTNEDGEIQLTERGSNLAQTMVRRHRLAERFLTDVLNLSWAEAHHEAGKWEHVISPRVEAAIVEQLGDPTTCPHGNPIPGSNYVEPELFSLAEAEKNKAFVITRIPEELEFTPGLLEFLEENNVLPGTTATVIATAPDGATTIDVDGQVIGISAFTAERILVQLPAGTAALAD
ncbi:MAG: metal-dependent transcriptional regulator [Acidimicrobiia bacterium]|nr:metal-dependent transcriptional regulator [Acidimicrobiia bacterium]